MACERPWRFMPTRFLPTPFPVQLSPTMNWRKAVAGLIIAVFTFINLWSVKGVGKIEDLMIYTKLVILIMMAPAS